jgi:type IV secretion system protein VirB5
MRRFLSAIAMVAASWAAPAAAQIPVFDAGSIAQAIEQLKALQAHMDQLKQTHASFNKITNMGEIEAILMRPDVRKTLPKDFSSMDAMLRGQGGSAQQWKDQDQVYVNTASPSNQAYVDSVNRSRDLAAGQKSIAQQMHESASAKLEGLSGLQKQIGQSEDPKTIADLQARLLVEIASIQALNQQMSAVQMAANADRQADELARGQQFEKDLAEQINRLK